jgi:nitrogen-specific signal transduction histidine kinase
VVVSHKRLGSGLGTKLVKDVIDAHGGRIAVESTVDVGTTFMIFLPLTPAAAGGTAAVRVLRISPARDRIAGA